MIAKEISVVHTAPQITYNLTSDAVSSAIQDTTPLNLFTEQPAAPLVDVTSAGNSHCTSDSSPNNLSDEDLGSNSMVRRGTVFCPPERVIEAPGQTPKPKKQISPPIPPDGKQSGDPDRHCWRLGTGLTLYVTCAGPEVAQEEDGLIGWVMNCYLGNPHFHTFE